MNRVSNPNCCGGHCRDEVGEVRKFPLGGGANLILCLACWAYENHDRYERAVEEVRKVLPANRYYSRAEADAAWQAARDKYPQLSWFTAEVVS